MDPHAFSQALYKALARAIFLTLGIVVAANFIDTIQVILLFFLLAVIFAIALAPPVNWLEKRRVPRVVGTLLVLSTVIGMFVGLGFLIAPRISAQTAHLSQDLPRLVQQASNQIVERIGHIRGMESVADAPQKILEQALPSTGSLVNRIGRYSVSLLTGLLSMVILLSIVAYLLILPRPLLRGLLGAVPAKFRDPFARAFTRGSNAVVRWVWANAMIGAIEAVAVTIFLSVIGVPGAFLWGLVTFFGEMIPQIGSYLMAVPPVIVAFAIDPMLALWVIVFYTVMQQVVNNVLAPPIRSKSMDIHPVSEIFAVLALTLAFGILGAIMASPLVAFAKAFYDEFYKTKQPDDEEMGDRVEAVLQRSIT